MEDLKKRSTCIICNRKRFQTHLISFSFVTWLSPITKSTSYHYACRHSKHRFESSCYEKLINSDFNVVIIPYSR